MFDRLKQFLPSSEKTRRFEEFSNRVVRAFDHADIVALGECGHGTKEALLRVLLPRLSLDGIYFEHPIDDQVSIDHYSKTGKFTKRLLHYIEGAKKEGKDILGTDTLIFDYARKRHIPIFCIDSSKTQTDEYKTRVSRGFYFLKGESRDEDMCENIKKAYKARPGKYIWFGGSGHIQDGNLEWTGLPSLKERLKKSFGDKVAFFTLI